MVNLPEWFLEELPEIQEPALLMYKDNQYFAVSPSKEKIAFSIIDEAYDHIKKSWKLEVDFDESLPEHKKGRTRIYGSRTTIGTRLFISSTDSHKIKKFEKDYEYFLNIAEQYKNNPNDFRIVYQFVDTHPAFWSRASKEHPWNWDTYGHCDGHIGKLSLSPIFNKDEEETYDWIIETGPHVEPDYNERYHDYRLDSHGSTVEEAFINLAMLINKFFNLDGTEKENVEHKKPDWIVEIEKRLEETN